MVQSIGELEAPTLQSIPPTGEHYAPLINEIKDGQVYSHAYQTILADPETLYTQWRDVSSIPLWQEHVVSCTPIDSTTSHWIMGNPEEPDGKRIEFDSQIIEDQPGKKLAWKSIAGDVEQSGSVTFTPHPGGRGTIVLLQQVVKMPGGRLGNAAASIAARGPKQTVIENLRHFKEMCEAGEIPSVKGQPHGPRGVTGEAKEWMYGEKNPTPPGAGNVA